MQYTPVMSTNRDFLFIAPNFGVQSNGPLLTGLSFSALHRPKQPEDQLNHNSKPIQSLLGYKNDFRELKRACLMNHSTEDPLRNCKTIYSLLRLKIRTSNFDFAHFKI